MSVGGVEGMGGGGRTGEGPSERSLVLVLNAGSSSLKAQLLDPAGRPLWKGQTNWQPNISAPQTSAGAPSPAEAVLRDWLLPAIAPWTQAVALVGDRVVHGGTAFTGPPGSRRRCAPSWPSSPPWRPFTTARPWR